MAWREAASAAGATRARPWLSVTLDGVEVALARVGEAWFAVEDRCSHAGCPFSSEASIEDGRIVCNCHGSEFELATGEVVRGPAENPVRTFPVRLNGDVIEVDV